jgi:uncharacterized YigZ family protein
MQSIMDGTTYEFIEKKSRFIGILYHLEDVQCVHEYIEKTKEKYPGANHYVYAYIIQQNNQKASDDGEPQRTAGYPILDVLKKQGINDCLAVVVRYFGGIKLGAGGLIRAYAHTISEAIKKATFIHKVTQYHCSIVTTYENLNQVERIIREKAILNDAQYGEKITIHFHCFDHQFDTIKDQLFHANHFKDYLTVIQKDEVYAKVSDSYIQTKKQ